MEIIELDPNKKYIFNLKYADEKKARNFMKLIKGLMEGPEQFAFISIHDLESIDHWPPEEEP